MGITILAIVITGIVAVLLLKVIRMVPAEQRLIVFRLGRLLGSRGPGLVYLAPVLDQAIQIDIGFKTLECKTADVPVGDSTPAHVTSVVRYRVTDAVRAATQVADYKRAFATLVETKQRSFFADRMLTDLFAERSTLKETFRDELAQTAQAWGIEVSEVEIPYVEISEEARRDLEKRAEEERKLRGG